MSEGIDEEIMTAIAIIKGMEGVTCVFMEGHLCVSIMRTTKWPTTLLMAIIFTCFFSVLFPWQPG